MSTYYQISCNNIGCTHLNDITKTHCAGCGLPLPGTINTRRATIPAEIEALDNRYTDAKNFANSNNLDKELALLETEVTINGKAVINTSIDFLWKWLVQRTSSYDSYKRQLLDGTRSKAKYEDDNKRTVADSLLFGSEIDIIYSALTTDETGLSSYGHATIILKTKPIEKRTSSLETNSYFFFEWAKKNGWTVFDPLPAGYMAVWSSNSKLAVAKLTKSLKSGISGTEIAKLILTSKGDRSTDIFIELYIYGEIASSVIEKIKIPATLKTSLDPKSKLRLKEIEKKVAIEYF